MTGLSRYDAPRGTTLCESVAGELYLASEADAVISELRSQLDAAEQALKASDLRLAQADHNYDMDRNQWRQQLAEQDVLLQKIRHAWECTEGHEALFDVMQELSASAEPAKCSACACGRSDPHAQTVACIKAAGDAMRNSGSIRSMLQSLDAPGAVFGGQDAKGGRADD